MIMSYSHQASAYREREIQSASPARLIVLLFEHAHANLLRARHALQTGNIEARTEAVGKARDAIMELLVSLDTERGGDVARNLKSLYVFILSELVEVVRRHDGGQLESIIHMVSDLRSAFEAIATDASRAPAA
jgi:flagellar secretion chaperone FliS